MRSHEELQKWYQQWEETTQVERTLAERDRDYYDGKQWTEEERATLEKRKQPIITINRIAPKINFIAGTEIKIRSDPKAEPRTPNDMDVADVATDTIRYVLEENNWDQTRSMAANDLLLEGVCAGEVGVELKYDEICVTIKRMAWDRILYDPHASAHDFSDAKFCGSVMWMDREDALATWPDAAEIIESTTTPGDTNTTHEDKPHSWSDPSRDRIKVCQMWWRDTTPADEEHPAPRKDWYVGTITGAGFVEKPTVSPYVNRRGETEPGLVLQACYIDRQNAHYGVVRNLIPIQDEINKRRSKALHLISMRQSTSTAGAFADIQELKRELARPDAHIEVPPGADFQILPAGDMAQAQFLLLEESKREIDTVGPSALATGHENRAMSGRAQQVAQQSGQTELESVFDRARNWQRNIYRLVFSRIQQFWTDEKYIRVRDSDQNIRFIQINQPVTKRMAVLEAAEQQGVEVPPEMLADPALDEVIDTRNNIAELDVDIILTDAPDTVSLRQEQFEILAGLAERGLPIPPDIIIEASNIRDKKKILDRIRGTEEQQAQQAQMQQQQMAEESQARAVAMAQAQAKAQETVASTALKQAQAADTQVDMHIKAAEAQAGLNLQAPNPPAGPQRPQPQVAM